MKSLIIIAHGSRKEISNNEVLEIVNQVKNSETNYTLVEPAFLEFASPTLEDSVKTSIDKNCLEIFIYPYFLNSGKHVTADIPDEVTLLKEKYPQIKFTVLTHFGQSAKINEIILSDTDI
jgi:sirohydrochlorin cobaltochelatase